jgi:hypothetical protein
MYSRARTTAASKPARVPAVLQASELRRGRLGRQRALQGLGEGVGALHRGPVGLLDAAVERQVHRGPDAQAVAEVVEDGAAVHEHPLAIGEVGVRAMSLGDARLEPPDRAVAEVADQTADEGRCVVWADELEGVHQLAEGVEGRKPVLEGSRSGLLEEGSVRSLADERDWLVAEEGVPAPALAALDGLQQEGVGGGGELEEGADRRLGVPGELAPDRDEVPAGSESLEAGQAHPGVTHRAVTLAQRSQGAERRAGGKQVSGP